MKVFFVEANTDTTAFPFRLHHATRGKAIRLASAFEADWPALRLNADYDGEGDNAELIAWEVTHVGDAETVVYSGDTLPDLADVLEACEAEDLDPAEGMEEQEYTGGSVVDPAYRAQYRDASSTGQSCGDWLAEWLADETLVGGKLHVESLEVILSNNGVDLSAPWAKAIHDETARSRGWQGRTRMSGRNALEKLVAKAGVVLNLQGAKIALPEDALQALRDKHAKWLAKEAKREAAEAEVAEAAAGK